MSPIEIGLKILIGFGTLFLGVAYLTLLERRVLARMQARVGPNRVGPHGLLQPIADGVKLLFKEELVPGSADRFVFLIAPMFAVIPAIVNLSVIPFGESVRIFGHEVALRITDVNTAFLVLLASSSMGVYGVFLAGWSSNNKYSLLGGLRSSAQMISYEIALGLSTIGVLILAGSFSLVEIVHAQARLPYVLLQPVGFFVFFVASIAEVNRTPFDLPEAETELVAGFHTEYSSMKFAFFYLGEYMNMVVVSSLATTLFLGGWLGPGPAWLGPVWFLLKVLVLLLFFVWTRATLPRFRYDQLMNIGWKILLPLSLANIVVTAVWTVLADRG